MSNDENLPKYIIKRISNKSLRKLLFTGVAVIFITLPLGAIPGMIFAAVYYLYLCTNKENQGYYLILEIFQCINCKQEEKALKGKNPAQGRCFSEEADKYNNHEHNFRKCYNEAIPLIEVFSKEQAEFHFSDRYWIKKKKDFIDKYLCLAIF